MNISPSFRGRPGWLRTCLFALIAMPLLAQGAGDDDRARNDWAFLKAYQAKNLAVGQPAPSEQRVVFMGDSITEFWDAKAQGFFANRAFVNRGISGQTTPQMLLRFRQDVIALKPKVVVILAGTNDIAGNTGPATVEMIADNIASMAELARVHGIRVVLSSVLPVNRYPW